MITTTRQQRVALKRKYDQSAPKPYLTPEEVAAGWVAHPITYKQFRRSVQPTFGCDGAVTVQWCGMWLCIERNGYCHS